MKKHRILALLALICLLAVTVPMAVSAVEYPDNGWVQGADKTWRYRQDGQWVTDTVMSINGAWYSFDADGLMRDNEEFWYAETNSWYRARSGGKLYVNAWHQDPDGTWYYYGADGKAGEDFVSVNGVWYFFFANGAMAEDQFVWSEAYQNYYAIDQSGANYAGLKEKGWHQVFDREYYLYEEPDSFNNTLRVLNAEIMTLNGTTYCFEWNGHLAAGGLCSYYDAEQGRQIVCYASDSGALLEPGWRQIGNDSYYILSDYEVCRDQIRRIGDNLYSFDRDGKLLKNRQFFGYNPEAEAWCEMIASDDGAILQNGWGKIGGVWYYADADGALYYDDIYEIGGRLYVFLKNGAMYDMPGQYGQFYVSDDGTLLRNAWSKDLTENLGAVGWAYYDNNGYRVTGKQTIEGKVYYFNSRGIMQTSRLEETDDGTYLFGTDGVGTLVNGWVTHPRTKNTMYIKDGCPVRNAVLEISGKTYAFDGDGYMVINAAWHGTDWFLFDEKGQRITEPGWKKVNHQWYFVESDGSLAVGFVNIGSALYCLDPVMQSNTIVQNPLDGRFYGADINGGCTPISGDGLKTIGEHCYYLSQGVPQASCWQLIGTAWYYFDGDGRAVTNGTCTVKDITYLFDANGKMYTAGWMYTDNDTYYAGNDGVAYTGMKTVDGKRYIFDDYGRLQQGKVVCYENTNYLLALDGSILTNLNQEGWVQVGTDWYYVEDGQLLHNCLIPSGNQFYGLGSDGRMCSGGVRYAWWDYYLFDARGIIQTGWQKVDGNWYYGGRTDTDPALAYNGVYTINGKDYAFREGVMQTGTFLMEDMLMTADGSGAIVSREALPEGWVYTGTGYVYGKNGDVFYTGWVEDRFAENGQMVFARRVEYKDRYYYMKADGTYLQEDWLLDPEGRYVYAKKNGVLCYNEWLLLNDTYYYFNDSYMVKDSVLEINGKLQKFDRSGKWIGEVTVPSLPEKTDGWQMIAGKWYYYRAGAPVTGRQYINNVWYAFYSDGVMLANTFDKDGRYYYNASGAQMTYTGWQQIAGNWYYFTNDHAAYSGWIRSGKGWYYTDCTYDTATGSYLRKMAANTALAENGKLYRFNASGYTEGAVSKTNGWYQAGSDWYYFENGVLVADGYRKMGITGYYFVNGKMQTNLIVPVGDSLPGLRYFGSNGKEVTAAGWWNTAQGWIYVGNGGILYQNGIYRIDGKEYAFRDGIWIQN